MSSLTSKVKLNYNYLLGENGWKDGYDENWLRVDTLLISTYGWDRANSSLLVYAWLGGYALVNGQLVNVSSGTITLPDNTTRYIERDPNTGTVYAVATRFTVGTRIPMAVAVTLSGSITTVTDARSIDSLGDLNINKRYNVKLFGAVGDGTTDDTTAIQAAATALIGGGRLFFPSSDYKVTAKILLHVGTTVEGTACPDKFYGAPPTYAAEPSYIFQATPNTAIFSILGDANGGTSDIVFRDISLSPILTFTAPGVPANNGKVAIELVGSYPYFVWNITIERVKFYHLDYGIQCIDPHAGTNAPPYDFDWSVAPVRIKDSRFYQTKVGIYIDTNNADDWIVDGCGFFVPSGGTAIALNRAGFIRVSNTFGAGTSVSTNKFISILGVGVSSVDNILLDNCQAETLTHFIYLDPAGTYAPGKLVITARDCIAEMGADVYLGNACHFISHNTRWASTVYIDDVDVKLSSIIDRFEAGFQFTFLSGSPSTSFVNLIPGPYTSTLYTQELYLNGFLTRHDNAPPVSGTYKVGDRVYNLTPTVGQPKSWVCIAAGTPGTWVSEGNL